MSRSDQEKNPVSHQTGHVPQWTLEQFAEDALPQAERAEVQAHVERCVLCAAELDAFRSLVTALSALPRFAPSPGFTDAVMARVRIQARTSPAFERLRRWLPSTRRGWTMLVAALLAPLVPLLAAVGWLLSHPLVTVGGLWTMGKRWMSDAFWSLFARGMVAVGESGLWGWGQGVAERAWELSASGLGGLSLVAVFLAVATPLSVWTLVRLLRTPTGGDVAHAH